MLALTVMEAYSFRVAKLLALFTIVPLVETYLLYVLGRYVGIWPTVALVLATALAGATLGKREGLKVWRSWQQALGEGRIPEEGILGGVLVLVGAVLLITPGVLTDLAGLALLLPPSRRLVARVVRTHLEKRFAAGQTAFRYRVDLGDGRVIEEMRAHFGGRAADGAVIDAAGEVIEERRRGEPKANLEG